ncbi:MAG TPA: SAM-dependent methyltransferase, partial [Kiritimatiellia bacterium]|nr:SAM-dependent methyltransferase [Kiritimatiellia bacterium]
SAKDLPDPLPPGLAIADLLPARDIRDALILRPDLQGPPRIIGTSSPKRSEEILKLHPRAQLQNLRGAIHQRLDQLDHRRFDAIIVAACALQRLGLDHRIHSYLPYDPTPNQGRLAIVVRADRPDLLGLLYPLDIRQHAGLIVLLGAPADSTLLSARAARYLEQADIVLHDRLIPDDLLLSIHHKAVPVGKAGGEASTPQSEIHRRMLHAAEAGNLVVRLHGGDPGIYGHLDEQLAFLTAWNLRVDIVPAVTAAQVAAARLGAPLTNRDDGYRLTLISGNPPHDRPPADLPGPQLGNLAVYMGVREIAAHQKQFLHAGWPSDTPVLIGERLGYPDEHLARVSLSDLPNHPAHSPAVFLLGPHSHPLRPATLFLGTDPEHFLKHGPLIHWPLIRLVPVDLHERVEHLRRELPHIRGLLFPSRFAVHTLLEALMELGDIRLLHQKALIAVGPSTRDELARLGLRADLSAPDLGGVQSLLPRLTSDHAGTYLYPCSDHAPRRDRVDAMKTVGIDLHPAIFYRNRRNPLRQLPRIPFDRVLFTSGSTVDAYFTLYPEEKSQPRTWLAVGPSTLAALQRHGLHAHTLLRSHPTPDKSDLFDRI